jgi:hypothetical protein
MTDTATVPTTDLAPVGIALHLPDGALTPNGLRLTNEEYPYEDWIGLGRMLGAIGRVAGFAIGDWYVFGEKVYGEDQTLQATEATPGDRYDLLNRVTGLEPATLMNYVSLSRRVPLEVRREELSRSMHEPVAALEQANQIYWLDQAVVNGWTREQLRDAIKAANTPEGDETPADETSPAAAELSRSERVEEAASLVWHQGQPTEDGGALIPAEAWAQLGAALGYE